MTVTMMNNEQSSRRYSCCLRKRIRNAVVRVRHYS